MSHLFTVYVYVAGALDSRLAAIEREMAVVYRLLNEPSDFVKLPSMELDPLCVDAQPVQGIAYHSLLAYTC